MNIVGKKVILRAIEEEDLEILRQSINSEDTEKMITGWAFSISKKNQEKWYENYKNSFDSIKLIIENKENKKTVGMISLNNIDQKNGVALESGIRITDKEMEGKGIATDAWMTILRYAFNELRLNRVNATVLPYNKVSMHVCQKVGFKIEGTQRQMLYRNGQYHDLIVLGCLKTDYEKVVGKCNYWEED